MKNLSWLVGGALGEPSAKVDLIIHYNQSPFKASTLVLVPYRSKYSITLNSIQLALSDHGTCTWVFIFIWVMWILPTIVLVPAVIWAQVVHVLRVCLRVRLPRCFYPSCIAFRTCAWGNLHPPATFSACFTLCIYFGPSDVSVTRRVCTFA